MRRAMRRNHEHDGDAYSAGTMRTIATLGLAASILFVGLTIVVLGRADGDREQASVLGATAGPRDDLEVASTDGGAFFVYAEDPRDNVAGSATVIVRGRGEVTLTVSGTPEGDRAVISVTVQNATDDVIVFGGGLTVTVDIALDGVPWRTAEPSDRSVTELPPGQSATVSTEVVLDAHGEYELSGEVLYARR